MARNDKTRPAELVGLALGAGLFVGAIVLFVTRDLMFAAVGGGAAFIVTIVTLAMIILAMSPPVSKPDTNPHD